MNALLDYGSSSSSDTDEESSVSKEASKESNKLILPKPSIGENVIQTSVFSNPFVEAELAKAAILEKHVKMVPGKEDTRMINGKKICWNYRKGRCRFGHMCKYAHDSDIQKTQEVLEIEKKNTLKNAIVENPGTVLTGPPPTEVETVSSTDDAVWEGGADKRKLKRPGLSQSIVPGKKVLKMYKDLKTKEFNNKK